MQHKIQSGQHEGGADQIGKGNNSTEGLGESVEEQKHRYRNIENITDICLLHFAIRMFGMGALGGDEGNLTKNNGLRKEMLQEGF